MAPNAGGGWGFACVLGPEEGRYLHGYFPVKGIFGVKEKGALSEGVIVSLPMSGGFEKSPGLLERFVKRCPLCGGLNVVSQRCCAKCGWGGGFEQRGEILREAVLALFSGEEENGEVPQVFRCVGFVEGVEDDEGLRDSEEG